MHYAYILKRIYRFRCVCDVGAVHPSRLDYPVLNDSLNEFGYSFQT